MAEKKRRINFSSGYLYDHNKTAEENWAAMKKYYAKKGMTIKDLAEEEKAEIRSSVASRLPDLEKMIKEYSKNIRGKES